MSSERDVRRLPKSLRKHLRNEKARLRDSLPPEEAEKAVERLVRRVRRAAGGQSEPAAGDAKTPSDTPGA